MPRRVLFLSIMLALTLSLVGVPPAQAAPTTEVASSSVELRAAPEGIEPPVPRRTVRRPSTDAVFARQTVTKEVALAAVVAPVGTDLGEVYLRTVEDGVTSDWTPLPSDDDAPDSTTTSTEPAVVSGADSVEVVSLAASGPVTLQVFASSVAGSDAQASDLAWANPEIRSRAAWSADESLVRNEYVHGVVTGAMIHHTAGTNNYTPEQVPALLRSIQAYHVNGRGWNDMAYNVLVDKFGRAWEGRGGGLTKAIAGGHAWAETNRRVFGISLMGNYDTVKPPAVMIETMNRVIAWKLRLHGVDPYGSTWGSGGQDGGTTYLPAISGHRDENATLCPGRYVYEQFAAIRARVKVLMGEARFADVPFGTAHYEHITWFADSGITTGYPDRTFRPVQPVNRDAMAAFLYRLAGEPAFDARGRRTFLDVPESTPFHKEIEWLAASGISTGWQVAGGTEFRPVSPVNRDAMAAFLYRLYSGAPDSTAPAETETEIETPFLDVSATTEFSSEIAWLAGRGISTGWQVDGGAEFRPVQPINRDAMAAFLHRAVDALGRPNMR